MAFISDNPDNFRMMVKISLESFDPLVDTVQDVDTQANFGGQTLPFWQTPSTNMIYVAANFGEDIYVRTNIDDRLYTIDWGKIVDTDPVTTFAYFDSIV